MFSSKFSSIVRIARPAAISASIVFFCAALPAQNTQIAVPSRIVSAVDDNARVTLHGYVHPLANAVNDRGAAPDSMPLSRMHLVLKRSPAQEAALQQFISDAHTPGSANYHKWLTPDQFGEQFGPSDQDIATVEAWLSSQGFEVNGVEPGKQVLEFTGSVAQLRGAFHTQIRKYAVNGNMHYAAANDPQIPAALAPVVGGFVSLNNFRPQSHIRMLGEASYDPKTGTAKPEWTVNGGEGYPTLSGVNFAITPGDFGVQYDLPNSALNSKYTGTTYDGTGQTIAIINEANINIDLVNQFRTLFGLPANPPNVIIDGNDPGVEGINNPDGPNYASGEAYLDVEWSGAVAPKATIDLVIAADTALESGLYLAAEHAVYGNVAPIISASFGACEADIGSTNQFIDQVLWEQAAAQGITVTVSTGDSGSAGCDNPDAEEYAIYGANVSGFASTPYDVAVGGTDFYYSNYQSLTLSGVSTYWNTTGSNTPGVSLLTTIPEQPWNNSQYGLDASNYYNTYGATTIGAGSGGASSAAVCASGYNQTTGACNGAVAGYPKPSWQTGTGVPADSVRDIPDVSLFAADGPNYSYYAVCYLDGDCQPNSSGAVQVYGVGGTSASAPAFAGIMALVNEKYGRQGQADFVLYPLKAQFPAAFHDITVGTNSVPCNTTTLNLGGTVVPPVSCIAAKSPITITDPNYGVPVVEGQIGTGSTPEYNAAAGYNLATGLGSVDAAVLVADWGNVTFKSTTTTLTPSSTSVAHGTPITLSGSVTGTGTPSGNVAVMTTSTTPLQQSLGLFPLTAGAFSGSVNYLPGGTYDLWGQYSGDGTNATSASTPVQVTVTPENSTTSFDILNETSASTASVIANNASVSYGSQLILAAQVHPTSSSTTTPTGTITFTDGGTTVNTATLNAEDDAEFNAPFAVGSHTVTASYSGDSSYNTSSGSSIAFTVTKNTPTLLLATSYQTNAGALPSGQADVLTVVLLNSTNVVTESNGSTTTPTGYPYIVPVAAPTGTISITGISGVSSATLMAGVDPATGAPAGVATIAIPASAATGTPNVSISYAGDSNYSSTSGSLGLPFAAAGGTATTTTASLSGSVSPTTFVTLSGSVKGSAGGAAPTGSVVIYAGGYYLLQIPIVPQSAALNQPPVPQLRHFNLFATGGGAVLACVLLLCVPARRRAWRNMLGVLLVVCVIGFGVGCGGGGSSSGSGGGGGGGSGGGGGGTALSSTFAVELNSQSLLQGSNTITVQYEGDTTYAPSSYTFSTAVNNPLSDFSLTASTAIIAVSGGTGGDKLFVTPTNGFTGTVNLSCGVVGSPTGVSCSLSPTSVSLTAASSTAVTLTVSTTGSPTAGNYQIGVTGTSGSQIHTLGVTAAVP